MRMALPFNFGDIRLRVVCLCQEYSERGGRSDGKLRVPRVKTFRASGLTVARTILVS